MFSDAWAARRRQLSHPCCAAPPARYQKGRVFKPFHTPPPAASPLLIKKAGTDKEL
jgi:hypothetical protein